MTASASRMRKKAGARIGWRGALIAALVGVGLASGLAWAWSTESAELWRLDRTPTPQLERKVKEAPEAPWPAYVLGGRYALQGRLPEAMDLFERSRDHAPNSYRSHFSLGRGFIHMGAPQPAAESLKRAAALAPSEPRVQLFYGVALRECARLVEAGEAGQRAVRLAPRNAEAWYELGRTFYRPTMQPGEGRRCFAEAVKLAPERAAYRQEYGRSLADNGEYAEALPHLREAVRLAPNDAAARYLLARTLHRGSPEAHEEAVRELRHAIKLEPTLFQPRYELGVMLQETGDYAGALQEIRASAKANPGHAQSWFQLGNVAARLGRTAEAKTARERFGQLTRDRDERQFLERRIFDHPKDIPLRLKLAALLERGGALPAAGAQYQAILRLNPAHAQAKAALTRLDRQVTGRQPVRP
jgi:tetratricopeptide (TPR) repeat protein